MEYALPSSGVIEDLFKEIEDILKYAKGKWTIMSGERKRKEREGELLICMNADKENREPESSWSYVGDEGPFRVERKVILLLSINNWNNILMNNH